MHKQIFKGDRVETVDGRFLGTAIALHQRQAEINPQLKLYVIYLNVWDEQAGDRLYIPTDFIQEIDSQARRITLSVTQATVQKETWNRLPDFVAQSNDVEVALPVHPEPIKES